MTEPNIERAIAKASGADSDADGSFQFGRRRGRRGLVRRLAWC